MAINFVSDPRDISPNMFGGMADRTRNYFESTLNELESRFGNLRSTRVARERHEYYQGEEARRRKRMQTNESAYMDETRIHRLESLRDFRDANPEMINYIMSNPTIRRRARAQTIEGYNSIWQDSDDSVYLEGNGLYGSVISGLWETDDEGNDVMVDYNLDVSQQRELLITEVLDIKYSWANCMRHLEDDEDPTSPSGGSST